MQVFRADVTQMYYADFTQICATRFLRKICVIHLCNICAKFFSQEAHYHHPQYKNRQVNCCQPPLPTDNGFYAPSTFRGYVP